MENSDDTVSSKEKKCASTLALKPLISFYVKRKIRIPKRIPLFILAHARRIILGLEKGCSYMDSKGKRLSSQRELISIPVGRRWRLLAELRDGEVIAVRLLSHEAYNHKWNWEKR